MRRREDRVARQQRRRHPGHRGIVVFAVPYPALAAIVGARREQLAGKVVVDITNQLEALGFLQITLAAGGQLPWTGGFIAAG